jgi:trehalose/maltose hydrolase-like predicted phosphorylase
LSKLCKKSCDLAVEEFKKSQSKIETAQTEQQKRSKFSADGVYSYYKSFVARFLQAFEAPDHYEEHNLMVKIELTQKQLEKLRKFSEYSTKVDNSSIQDVTDILKSMIIGVEKQNFESLFIEWLNDLSEKLGINLYFICVCLGVRIILSFSHFKLKKFLNLSLS